MSDPLLEAGWPTPECRLLIRAYAAAEPEARQAWQDWAATRNIDTIGWAEARLLAAVAPKIAQLAPGEPLQKRLDGIRRFVWAANQRRLERALPAFDALAAAGIPAMLIKGGARLAADREAAASRLVRDLDVLVPRERADAAAEALIAVGYRPLSGKLPGGGQGAAFDGAYGTASRESEVDLHGKALRYGRFGTFDDGLWARALPVMLRGRAVKVPAAADQFIQALAHGQLADLDRPADWAIDAILAASDPAFSWDLVLAEAEARRIAVPVLAGTLYLDRDRLVAVPAALTAELGRMGAGGLWRREFYGHARRRLGRNLIDQAAGIAAEVRRSGLPAFRPAGGGALGRPAAHAPAALAETPARLKVGGADRLMVTAVFRHPPRGRLSFDLVAGAIWIARLKLRPPLTALPSAVWRFAVPRARFAAAVDAADELRDLKLVALDDDRVPLPTLTALIGWTAEPLPAAGAGR